MHFRVEQVPAERTYALRHEVLRPHTPITSVGEPGDDTPPAAAFAALTPEDAVLGTAIVRPAPCPWRPDVQHPWRLRGVATAPDLRGRGLGTAVLRAVVEYVRRQGGELIWCNARTPALNLYLREGFVTEGEQWIDPNIGPHIRMWLALAPLGE